MRQAPVQLLDLEAHLHPELRVEVGQRLVEQEHRGLANDRASHRDALALAARQLPRLAREERPKLEDRCRAVNARLDLVLREPADAQSVRHVVEHAHVRIQRVILEHHRDVAVLGLELVHHTIADRDVPGGDCLEPGHHAQERGLAAAGGTDDDDELPVRHVRGDAVDDLEVSIALAYVA